MCFDLKSHELLAPGFPRNKFRSARSGVLNASLESDDVYSGAQVSLGTGGAECRRNGSQTKEFRLNGKSRTGTVPGSNFGPREPVSL